MNKKDSVDIIVVSIRFTSRYDTISKQIKAMKTVLISALFKLTIVGSLKLSSCSPGEENESPSAKSLGSVIPRLQEIKIHNSGNISNQVHITFLCINEIKYKHNLLIFES